MKYVVVSVFALVAMAACSGRNQGVQVGNGFREHEGQPKGGSVANFRSSHGFAVQFDPKLTLSEVPGTGAIRIDDTRLNPSQVSSLEVGYLDNVSLANAYEFAHLIERRHPGVSFQTVDHLDAIEKVAQLVRGDQIVQIRYLMAKRSKRTISAELRATKMALGVLSSVLESIQIDTEAPEILGVHCQQDFLAGAPAQIKVHAREKISGVKRIRAVFRKSNPTRWRATEHFIIEGSASPGQQADVFTATSVIPEHIVSGRYSLIELKATDGAGNEGALDVDKRAEVTVFVSGTGLEDHNRPEILDVKMPDTLRVGAPNQIAFRARDQESGIRTGRDVPVRLRLLDEGGTTSIEIKSATIVATDREEGYLLEFDLSRWVRSGNYHLQSLLIHDFAGNSNEIILKQDRYATYLVDGMTRKDLELANPGILGSFLNGFNELREYPRILNARFSKRKYRLNEVVQLQFTLSGPIDNEVRLALKMISLGNTLPLKRKEPLPILREGAKYFVEFPLNPWADLGPYYLEGLELQAGPTSRVITLDGVTWEEGSEGGDGSPSSREPRFPRPGFTVE